MPKYKQNVLFFTGQFGNVVALTKSVPGVDTYSAGMGRYTAAIGASGYINAASDSRNFYRTLTNVVIVAKFKLEAIDNLFGIYLDTAGPVNYGLRRSALNVFSLLRNAAATDFTMVPVAGRTYMVILEFTPTLIKCTLTDLSNMTSESISASNTMPAATHTYLSIYNSGTGAASRYVDLRIDKVIANIP